MAGLVVTRKMEYRAVSRYIVVAINMRVIIMIYYTFVIFVFIAFHVTKLFTQKGRNSFPLFLSSSIVDRRWEATLFNFVLIFCCCCFCILVFSVMCGHRNHFYFSLMLAIIFFTQTNSKYVSQLKVVRSRLLNPINWHVVIGARTCIGKILKQKSALIIRDHRCHMQRKKKKFFDYSGQFFRRISTGKKDDVRVQDDDNEINVFLILLLLNI